MVLIQDVEFASTSEHTLLPFYGRCHIAYVPRYLYTPSLQLSSIDLMVNLNSQPGLAKGTWLICSSTSSLIPKRLLTTLDNCSILNSLRLLELADGMSQIGEKVSKEPGSEGCSLGSARNGVVLGLSKVARLAKMFARRLQNQQRFTHQLLEAFNAEVQPLGCAAMVEATHLGRQHAAQTSTTEASFGCFYAQPETFMQVRHAHMSSIQSYEYDICPGWADGFLLILFLNRMKSWLSCRQNILSGFTVILLIEAALTKGA